MKITPKCWQVDLISSQNFEILTSKKILLEFAKYLLIFLFPPADSTSQSATQGGTFSIELSASGYSENIQNSISLDVISSSINHLFLKSGMITYEAPGHIETDTDICITMLQ